MKIKLLATSIAAIGCSLASAQQSQVTVYGNLDVGVSTQSTSALGYSATNPAVTANKGAVNKLQDGGIGGSNFGLKGTTDVGGGYKASFQLQGNANVDTGAGSANSGATAAPTNAIFNQIAKVAISGDFGEISLGRQVAPMYIAMGYTDAREARYSGSILSAFVGMNSSAGWGGGTTNAPLGAIYDDNAVIYVSPTINGFTGSLEYSFGEVPGNANAGSRISATGLYAANGWRLSAAVYNGYDSYQTAANSNGTLNNQFYHLGALYALDQHTFSVSYSKGKNPSGQPAGLGTTGPTAGLTTGTSDYDITGVGYGYKISPEYRFTSGYYNLRDNVNNANTSNLLALGLDRYLDKSTILYAMLGRVANQGTMNQAIIYGSPVGAGVETTALMVGVRRSF